MRHILHLAVAASLALLLAAAIVFGLKWVDARNQRMVTHVNQQPRVVPAYPVVLAHTLVDRNGNSKIVILHKLTKPMPTGVVPFQWVDLIALAPPNRHLHCVINGKPVRIGSAVKVFWAVDGSPPASLSLPNVDVAPSTAGSAKWDKLVGSRRVY